MKLIFLALALLFSSAQAESISLRGGELSDHPARRATDTDTVNVCLDFTVGDFRIAGNASNRDKTYQNATKILLNTDSKGWQKTSKANCETLCKKECIVQAGLKMTSPQFQCGCEYEDRRGKASSKRCALYVGERVKTERTNRNGGSKYCHVQTLQAA